MCHYLLGPYSDVTFLNGSASPNHIGDMRWGRRGFPECLNSRVLGQYHGVGHFGFREGSSPAALGLGTGIQKELRKEDSLFCVPCQVLTLLQDHVGKQAAEKRISGLGPSLLPHVRCQLSSGDSDAALGFCCLSCGSHKFIATVLLLVCRTDRNRIG